MAPRAGDDEDGPGADSAASEGGGPPWDEQLAPGSTVDGTSDDADATNAAGDDVEDGEDDDSEGDGVAGEFVPEGPVEPGTPTLENAVFVVVGAYLAVLATGELLVGVDGYSLRTLAAVTGASLLVAVVCFGFFGLLTPET